MLEISNLSKSYNGKVNAVDKLSLKISAGEICGFIGHNGAGKSTAIKCITGILAFEEGDIFIDGVSIKENPLKCKGVIAYVPDNPDIYDFLTGIQYLNFVADIYGVDKESRNELIKQYANKFDIEKNLGDPISSYSHGMRQKLVLISALIHSPKLLVLDEPFVGLDPIASHELKEFMREFCNNGGAIFFSSHVLEVVEKLCDKIGIIKQGKLIAYGDMQEVLGDKSLENLFLETHDA